MQYRINPRNNDKISALSYGCMRFPEHYGKIDIKASEPLLHRGFELGINYYDTAYPYHNEQSESFIGEFFSKNKLRNKVKIATKMPVWSINSYSDMENIFKIQTHKLKTAYIDYYLLHALNIESFNKVYNLGVLDFLNYLKKQNIILNAGFSFHGEHDEFIKIFDSFDWDFSMIQFNYLDINNQAGLKGLEYISNKNIAIMIMEPLRGGSLVNIPVDVKSVFNTSKNKYSPIEWSFKWLLNYPSITTLLSGMNTVSQIEENVKIVSNAQANSISKKDLEIVDTARKVYLKSFDIPCTQCKYCMPCPYGVDIPTCFDLYNKKHLFKQTMHAYIMYAQMINGTLGTYKSPSQCIKCGVCETKCPQNIKIIEKLKLVKKSFESIKMKLFFKLIKFIIKIKKLILKIKT